MALTVGTVRVLTPSLMVTLLTTEAALVIVTVLVSDTVPEVALMVTLPSEAVFSIFSLPSLELMDTPVGSVPSMLQVTEPVLMLPPY